MQATEVPTGTPNCGDETGGEGFYPSRQEIEEAMREWHGCLLATVACVLGLTQACSSPTGNGATSALAACDDYFEAAFASSCTNVLPPAGEIARLKARFETVCTSTMSLTGTGVTATTLEACVAAIRAGGCSVRAATTGPCALQGTLPSLGFGGIGQSGSGRHHGHDQQHEDVWAVAGKRRC